MTLEDDVSRALQKLDDQNDRLEALQMGIGQVLDSLDASNRKEHSELGQQIQNLIGDQQALTKRVTELESNGEATREVLGALLSRIARINDATGG